jgi:hypothetical protein
MPLSGEAGVHREPVHIAGEQVRIPLDDHHRDYWRPRGAGARRLRMV